MTLRYILIDFENVQPSAAELARIRGPEYRVVLFLGAHQTKLDVEVVKVLQPLGSQVEYVQCDRKGKNALDFRIAFVLGRIVRESELAVPPLRGQATFAVVSNDGGFDELLDHLQRLGYAMTRVTNIAAVPAFAADRNSLPSTVGTTPANAALGAIVGPFRTESDPNPAPSGAPAAKPAAKSASKPKAVTASPKQAVGATPGNAANDHLALAIANLRDHPHNRPRTEAALQRHLKTLLGKGATDAKARALMARLDREGITKAVDGKIEYRLPVKGTKAVA